MHDSDSEVLADVKDGVASGDNASLEIAWSLAANPKCFWLPVVASRYVLPYERTNLSVHSESDSAAINMCWDQKMHIISTCASVAAEGVEFGTVLRIDGITSIQDGALDVSGVGLGVVRISSRAVRPHRYSAGKVDLINYALAAWAEQEPFRDSQYGQLRDTVLHCLTKSRPDIVSQAPPDPVEFSWWAASLLPLPVDTRGLLIRAANSSERLSICAAVFSRLSPDRPGAPFLRAKL